jgi:DNA-binding transcriptional LysR family regulator
MNHILPLLPEFLARHPFIRVDWHFENRQVDLMAEGFDAAEGRRHQPEDPGENRRLTGEASWLRRRSADPCTCRG